MTERRPHEEARAVTDPLVVRALALFEEDPGKRWTVEELGRTLGVSRPVLGRRFVAAVGAPPLRTLTRTRLGRAAELLRTTDDGLAGVADAVGYDSEFSFSRAFRRQFGLPPGRYRAQLRRLDGLQTTSALEHELHRGVLTSPTSSLIATTDASRSFEATPEVTSVSTGRTVALAA